MSQAQCDSEGDQPVGAKQRTVVVELGKDVGLRIDPASIKSVEHAEAIIRHLMTLRARGVAGVLSGARQGLRTQPSPRGGR